MQWNAPKWLEGLGLIRFVQQKKNSELVISEKWKSSQCLTVEVETSGSSSSLFLSIVYAKCSVADRRDLWQDLFILQLLWTRRLPVILMLL